LTKREKIKAILDTFIPEFSVRARGSTSVDITKPGIDKAYGIGKLRDILGISLEEMIFIGADIVRDGDLSPIKWHLSLETIRASGLGRSQGLALIRGPAQEVY
jgi:hypothetical protein